MRRSEQNVFDRGEIKMYIPAGPSGFYSLILGFL